MTYQSPTPLANQKHRYTFLLYDQPVNWADDCAAPDWACISDDFQSFLGTEANARVGFNVSAFAEDGGLGEPVAGEFNFSFWFFLLSLWASFPFI